MLSLTKATNSLVASLVPRRSATAGRSADATPSRAATGANSHPKMAARDRPGRTSPRPWSIIAMQARNAISIAATFIARRMPSDAPAASASITFTCRRSTATRTVPAVAGVPVSGSRIFDR